MDSYSNHQVECDLCDDTFDIRLEGATTECGTCCCEACCEESVEFVHTDDEVFAYLTD
jgi:hypothetical protein